MSALTEYAELLRGKIGVRGEMLFTTFAYDLTDTDGTLVAKLAWTEMQRP